MASDELQALWTRIKADLRLARSHLPVEADSNRRLREYHEYLDHNELELACDMLDQYAEENGAGPAFWLALRDAAAKMGLTDRASTYDARSDCPQSHDRP